MLTQTLGQEFGKGLRRNGLFLLLSIWDLSWEDLKAQGEAADGSRNRQKGLFTQGWCLGWEGWKAGTAKRVPTCNPSTSVAISGLLAFLPVGLGFQHKCSSKQGRSCTTFCALALKSCSVTSTAF